jgi:hypothetical protein
MSVYYVHTSGPLAWNRRILLEEVLHLMLAVLIVRSLRTFLDVLLHHKS